MLTSLANLLTLFRLIAAPVIGLLLLLVVQGWISGSQGLVVATALFITACLSDIADGMVARRMGQESTLGAVLDPVADKLLMLFTGLGLVALSPGFWYGVPIALMLSRDLLVGGLREASLAKGTRLSVRKLGKAKTVVQCLVLALALADLSATALGLRPAPSTMVNGWIVVGLWAATALSWYSALDYLRIFGNKP